MTRFENRPMAPWPAPALSREFAPAFERAFADRFGGRDVLVRFHHGALLRAFGVSSLATVMRGNDGWFYWLGEDGHSLDRHYRATLPFAQSEVDNTVAEFARRRDWLAARGIAYVVVVVPEKFTIYPEHLPTWVVRSPRRRRTIACAPPSERDGRVPFVDLRAPLLAAKARERVYFQTDSHWNYNGAIVGYGETDARGAAGAAAGQACRQSRRHRARPTCRAWISTAAIWSTCSACRRDRARGRRRAARQGAGRRRRAGARGASTRTSSRASSSTRATGPACRAQSCCATRWRSR